MEEVAPGARHAAHVEMSGSGRIVVGRRTGAAAAAAVAAGEEAALGARVVAVWLLLWLVAAAPALEPMGAAGWGDSDSAAFVRRALRPTAVPPPAAAPAAPAEPVSSAAGPSGDELPALVPLSGRWASRSPGGGGAFDDSNEASVPAAVPVPVPVPVPPAAASMMPTDREEDILYQQGCCGLLR